MAEKFTFELVSPERLLVSQQVEMVVVPGGDGNFGVLRGHAPLLSTVRPGVIDVYATRAAVSERLFVAGGFAEVTGDRCTVLAEEAVPVAEIDRAAAERAIAALTEELASARSDIDRRRIETGIETARARRDAAVRA